MDKKILKACAGIMLLFSALSIFIGCRNAVSEPRGSFDFQYDSAKLLTMRIDPYEETLRPTGLSQKLGLEYYYDTLEANQFPSMLILLTPYTFFEPMVANWLWMISNILFSVGIVILVRILFFDGLYRTYCVRNHAFSLKDGFLVYSLFASILFISLPWRNNIGNGQHTIMAFFFFLLSMWLAEKGKDSLSGLVLAVSFFKYTLTVPLALWFLYKKKYKPLIISVGVHVALTIVSAFWLNKPVMDMIIEPLKVSSNFVAGGSYDLGAVFNLHNQGMYIALVLLIAFSIYTVVGKASWENEDFFSLLTIFSLIIVYHMIYDYFVLIVPLITFLFNTDARKKASTVTIIIFSTYVFVIKRIILMAPFSADLEKSIDMLFAVILYASFAFALTERREKKRETMDEE